jgi:hypothetical protein
LKTARGQFGVWTCARRVRGVWCAVLALAIGVRALAGAGAPEAVGELPAGVDTVLVVQEASRIRSSPPGQAAMAALGAEGVLGAITPQWEMFARELGYGEQEAFDRLLGGRVVFASGPVPGGGGGGGAGGGARAWVVLTDVSPETDQRLKKRLEVAPRGVVRGHQILSIERGRFELTSHRRDGRAGERTVTLVIGPGVVANPALGGGRSALFDEMIGVLAGGGGGGQGAVDLRGTVLHRRLTAIPPAIDADVLVALRLDGAGGAQEPWASFALVWGAIGGVQDGAAAPDGGRSISAGLMLRDPARAAELAQTPVSGDAEFRRLSDVLDLAVVQRAGIDALVAPLATPAVAGVLKLLGRIDGLKNELPEAARALVGDRRAIGLSAANATRPVILLGLESTDRRAMAPLADAAVAEFVGMQERGGGYAGPMPTDFGGVSPGAVRVMPARLRAGSDPLPLILGGPTVAAWAFPGGDAGGRGWFALAVMGDEADAEERAGPCIAALGVDPAVGVRDRWLWLGWMRPRVVEKAVPALLLPSAGVRSGMRALEAVELRVSATADGELMGRLRVEIGAE